MELFTGIAIIALVAMIAIAVVVVVNIKFGKNDDEEYTPVYQKNSESKNHNPENEQPKQREGSNRQKERQTSFDKLSKYGGWVHALVICILVLVLVVGFLAFFVVSIEEEDILEGLYCLGISLVSAVSLYIYYIVCGHFFFAAIDKGYSDVFYLACVFFVPLVGHLLIIALPDRGNGTKI